MKLDLQFFGGRGYTPKGWDPPSGPSGENVNVKSTESLISARGEYPKEVDSVLSAAKDIEKDYGVTANDLEIATLGGKDSQGTWGFFGTDTGNVTLNKNFMYEDRMNGAYDRSSARGFHPSRGNKTAIEAVAYHEFGHSVAHKLSGGKWGKGYDDFCNKVVAKAGKTLGYKKFNDFTSKISGYATKNASETIAEAISDVYCNGNRASKESQAVVNTLNKYK